jgi:hypothetical protein
MKRLLSFALVAAIFSPMLLTTGCSKGNIFGWAHSAGSNTSSQALSSDAYAALKNKDYAKALEYYNQILANDPKNSEAIYGYSVATLAGSGLDISSIVASILAQQSGSAAPGLSEAIAYGSGSPAATNLLPSSILHKLFAMETAVNSVLAGDKLKKILKGQADGGISPDNADLNLNVAMCLIIRAAITACKDNKIILNSNYSVTVNSQDALTANSCGQDIASAFQRLKIVVRTQNLASDSTIAKIQSDVNNLFGQLSLNLTGFTVNINTDYYLLSN